MTPRTPFNMTLSIISRRNKLEPSCRRASLEFFCIFGKLLPDGYFSQSKIGTLVQKMPTIDLYTTSLASSNAFYNKPLRTRQMETKSLDKLFLASALNELSNEMEQHSTAFSVTVVEQCQPRSSLSCRVKQNSSLQSMLKAVEKQQEKSQPYQQQKQQKDQEQQQHQGTIDLQRQADNAMEKNSWYASSATSNPANTRRTQCSPAAPPLSTTVKTTTREHFTSTKAI